MRRLALAAAAAGLLLAPAPAAEAQSSGACLGDLTADGVPKLPGPALRFGINPAGEAGALGPRVEPVPDDPPKTLAALARIKAPGRPLVVRLNRFFWSDGEAAVQRFSALTKRYADAGYLIELQLRYHPRPDQEGRIADFTAWVREVVRRLGADRRVIAVQVTNEVNLTISPDSSDGAYPGARDALVQGVIAAKDEARKRGYLWLTVGFNWVYRSDPSTENAFWSAIRAGGPRFLAALDWVGLDAYPGTFFPPVETPGGERDGMVTAISQLRRCYLPQGGIPDRVPIHLEENGWPTGPGRTEEHQAEAMRLMIEAVNDFRGTYNVTDYRWFDLRDHSTASANFQHHYGLLRDDYSPKPAFDVYRGLVASLARREDPLARPRPRLTLGFTARGRRAHGRVCLRAPVRARITGSDVAQVRRVLFGLGRRSAGRDLRRPFSRRLPVPGARRTRTYAARALVRLRDGRLLTLKRTLRACPR